MTQKFGSSLAAESKKPAQMSNSGLENKGQIYWSYSKDSYEFLLSIYFPEASTQICFFHHLVDVFQRAFDNEYQNKKVQHFHLGYNDLLRFHKLISLMHMSLFLVMTIISILITRKNSGGLTLKRK